LVSNFQHFPASGVSLPMKNLTPYSKIAVIGLLTLCAAGAVWFLCRPGPPVWRLRTIFHIGSSINPTAVLEGSPDAEGTLERYSIVVALISTPVFRDTVAGSSEFQPDSAALSKRLVFNTLRAHALDNNVDDVEIDLTAASAADCRAAYRTIARQIEQRHALLFDENVKLLQAAIDDYRERSIQLKRWEDAAVQPGYQASTGGDRPKSDLGVAWEENSEHLRQLEAMKPLLQPTIFPPESQVYVNGPLSNNTVRLSALAALAVILCAFILTLGLEARSSRRRNTQT
jgi:hypothetical protein